MLGTPPDLDGRWLALAWIDVSGDQTSSVATLWEITTSDGKPVLTQRFVTLPDAPRKALDAANEARQPWKPSPADLVEIRSAWDRLPAVDPQVARVEHEIAARDGFDESLKKEPRAKDAIWVERTRHDSLPSAAPVMRQVFVYAALAASDGDYTGNFDGATLAAAPFPVPISFKGSFRLYRVEAPSTAQRILRRLVDLFRGCSRAGPAGGPR